MNQDGIEMFRRQHAPYVLYSAYLPGAWGADVSRIIKKHLPATLELILTPPLNFKLVVVSHDRSCACFLRNVDVPALSYPRQLRCSTRDAIFAIPCSQDDD
jgi:hypothetical protein